MSDPEKKVECAHHGSCAATFVCRHLARGVGCGFHDAGGDDPWPDAWCDACDEVLERDGGWTDGGEAFAKITLQCSGCYERARERNRVLPVPLAPGALRLTSGQIDDLQRHARRAVNERQESFCAEHDLDSYGHWAIGQGELQIVFSNDGRPDLVADFQVVGSFSLITRTWLWAWDNGYLDPAEIRDIGRLRVFGEVRSLPRLTTPKWEATEEDAWDMTALAAYILGASAVYRAPADQVIMFLLIRAPRLRH
jgi:hypothetical protein